MFAPFDHIEVTAEQVAMVNDLGRVAAGDDANLSRSRILLFELSRATGWLAVPASIVNLITDPNDLIRIESSGDTTCEFGQLLLGSASCGYRWDTGEWVFGFGTGWRDVYDNFDSSVSSNIDLACVELFEPSDIRAGVRRRPLIPRSM